MHFMTLRKGSRPLHGLTQEFQTIKGSMPLYDLAQGV